MVVAPDRQTAIVAHIQIMERPVPPPDRLILRGLDPNVSYRVAPWPDPGGDPVRRGGDLLMAVGLGLQPADPPTATPRGDFTARIWVLTAG